MLYLGKPTCNRPRKRFRKFRWRIHHGALHKHGAYRGSQKRPRQGIITCIEVKFKPPSAEMVANLSDYIGATLASQCDMIGLIRRGASHSGLATCLF